MALGAASSMRELPWMTRALPSLHSSTRCIMAKEIAVPTRRPNQKCGSDDPSKMTSAPRWKASV